MRWRSIRYFNLLLVSGLLISCASEPKNMERPRPQISVQQLDSVSQRKYDKAVKLMKDGSYLEAESLFVQLEKQFPKLAAPLANRAAMYLKEGRFLEAESVIDSAISRNRMLAELHNLRGVIMRSQGRFNEALDSYQNAVALDKRYPYVYLNLGVLYDIYLFDHEQAKRYYQTYARLRPDASQQVNMWLVDLQQRAQVSN